MAHLLGHPGCMESLRADLRDLQAAIADVSSRAGAVRVPSWKFPDQVSCELDVAALLERYRYSPGDPELSQHGHVVLLELLIDRLLLLLQTFTGYAEELLSDRAVPPARALVPGMSAGLTVRRYWCCMLKLGAFYQQLLAEKKASRKENPALPSSPQAGTPEKEPPKHCLPNVLELRSSRDIAPSTSLCLPSSVLTPASSASGSSLPRAAPSVPMQPTGTSPGPCATCTSIQGCLHKVGKTITSICQSQNIPSALSRFQEVVGDTTGRRTLSATDVSYWASEQSKDLSRISKHLQTLLQQVQPLRAELQESEKQKEKLRRQVEDMARLQQVERDTHAQQQKEAQQSLEAKNKEHLEAVVRLEQAKDDLQRGTGWGIYHFFGQRRCCASPETTKATLLEEMRTTMVARSRVLELEEKVQLLSSQQESLSQELSTTTTQLEKEKAKVESMERHRESLQAKQRTLLQQLDSLDQEREELQVSLGEAEEDKAQLQEQLQESREQHRQQQLQENVTRLQEQARELRERERLLVFFPELHVPTEAQFESTGSLTEDMNRQLQANSIRIRVLEQENARLGAVLGKVKAAAQEGVLK
ncbi:CC157 protein, partial [Eolophus roseicapillus]|nr:CC157 protein [Eolophus roseicapilla]